MANCSRRKRRFTEQGVQRLNYHRKVAPANGRLEIADELCPGLILRVTSKGAKSFSVIYKVPGEGGVTPAGRLLAGKQHRITLGSTPPLDLKTARERAREIMLAASQGRDVRRERAEVSRKRHQNTFDATFERFIEHEIKPSISSWKNVERALRLHVRPHWSGQFLDEIRRADIHAILDGLVARGLSATGAEVRKHLSRFFSWATDRELIEKNPIHGLKRSDLGSNEHAGRALSNTELRFVWQSAGMLGYPFGALFQLLILTGQRRNDWGHARATEIDFANCWLEIPRTRYKSRRDHIVPLSGPVLDVIHRLPACTPPNDFIFSSRDGRVPVSGFSRAKSMLDGQAVALLKNDVLSQSLQNYRLHDFRVTCETRLANLGFGQEIRDAVLGHAKRGLQKTYNKHDYFEEKKVALAAYAEYITKVVK
jgi:integrase